ncbi:MAG: polysaccharide biosynthesis/export family protein [Bacteroidetes bacterium]|mgnify:CR=1 FL=1|nr:polysaccharide biosynthesis/export family protein [Bacteroidota bacterium]
MNKFFLVITVWFAVVIALPSCRSLYPNQVFRQQDYQYFDLAQKEVGQYIMQPGDVFTLRVYSRDGFRLVDVINSPGIEKSGVSNNQTPINQNQTNSFTYVVDKDGVVKLPVLGFFYVKGYTESELERILAEKYAGLFVDPWVSVKVVNRRVFVFKGSNASVLLLDEYPISLIEAIAKTGGLDADAKAYKIRVIRGDVKNPQVHLVDLSSIEGIRKADLSIQPNDIIVVDRKKRVVSDVLRELSPYLGVVTTVTTLIILVRTIGK